MLIHRRSPPKSSTGLYIVVDHPWCGLGWLIGAAASWLVPDKPSFVYMSNHFYHPRDGRDSANKWEWFFEQELLPISYEIRNGRNHNNVQNNYRLTEQTVTHFRHLISEQWTVRDEILQEASLYVPDPEETLGVHYRGTDKFSEVARPDEEMVAAQIIRKKEELGLKRVLIATDDERALLALRSKLPFKVDWFKPHIRGTTNMGIHQQFGGYRQARETMIEIMAIGMTKHLLVGRSSVADAMLLMSSPLSTYDYYN